MLVVLAGVPARRVQRVKRDGFEIAILPVKGRAVITTSERVRGEFLLCYVGDIISAHEGNQREEEEQLNEGLLGKQCIDTEVYYPH